MLEVTNRLNKQLPRRQGSSYTVCVVRKLFIENPLPYLKGLLDYLKYFRQHTEDRH